MFVACLIHDVSINLCCFVDPAGLKGPQGDSGDTGAVGATGAPGDNGVPGAKGADGAKVGYFIDTLGGACSFHPTLVSCI